VTEPAGAQAVLDSLREQVAPELEPVRVIGEGTMGRVFLAREPALRRLVALKVLRDELAADAIARRRFEREARAAGSVSHPSVAAVHRVGRLLDGRPFIVMEYIDGRSLADLLAATGPQPAEEGARILAAVADALRTAHGRGVVHRDVRPGNVMLEAGTDRVVLVDFGIAALLETGSEPVTRLTRTGVRLGDPQHMSPEQLRGEPVGPESDLWAFGVLGYELLAGRRPFPGSTVAEVLTAVLNGEVAPLDELVSGTDRRLGALLRRCLDREPKRRPRAAEAAAELQAIRTSAGGGNALVGVSPTADADAGRPGSAAFPPPLRAFLGELKRRKVYRVAVGYVAGAFIVLQAADLITPVFTTRDADFWYRVIVALTMAGFPIALVLSWVFDVKVGDTASREAGLSWRGRVLPLIGLSVSIGAAIGVWLLLMG
jgi:tRNA A-37 threonylcarbamoyl transferase component Bud32